MSGKKSELMGAYRTLQSISGPVNRVQVTCPGFKFGPTVLSLDARMRCIQMERTDGHLTISWKTSEGLEGKMSLKDDATYQKSLILSPGDPRVAKFKYEATDKFLLKDQSEQWELWEWDHASIYGPVYGNAGLTTYIDNYRWYSGYGGGVYCDVGTSVIFDNCEIRGNRTNGGMSGQGGIQGDG